MIMIYSELFAACVFVLWFINTIRADGVYLPSCVHQPINQLAGCSVWSRFSLKAVVIPMAKACWY